MENTFLPGTVRQRLADLMKYHKVSQTDLALKIGCGDSLLSRFLTGKTDKIGDENIIRIARVFNVSTDFLLGVTNVPDRNNYEIDELGLSAQAARNLYTGKVNAQVVNRLLESPRFAELTYILEQYFNDTIASGFAAQNQLYATLANLTRSTVQTDAAKEAAKDISRLRTPAYQADLATIEAQFTKEIGKIFGTPTAFDYPKPVRLIQRIIQIATRKDSIVLDSFAGSGTTAQAVLNMNKHDGGCRRIILVEMGD